MFDRFRRCVTSPIRGHRKPGAVMLGGVCIALTSAHARPLAQSPASSAQPSARVLVPKITTRNLGSADPGATAELAANGQVDALAASLQISGTVTYSPSTDTTPIQLTLTRHGLVHLENRAAAGTTTEIINGFHAITIGPDGKKVAYTPEYALSGLAALAISHKKALLNAAAITDGGTITIAGTPLHKISLELVPHSSQKQTLITNRRYVVDLYFDPSTHLLSKVVSFVPVPGSSIPAMLRTMSFENYTSFSGNLLPSTITETLGGRVVSTLRITSAVATNEQPSSQLFSF